MILLWLAFPAAMLLVLAVILVASLWLLRLADVVAPRLGRGWAALRRFARHLVPHSAPPTPPVAEPPAEHAPVAEPEVAA